MAKKKAPAKKAAKKAGRKSAPKKKVKLLSGENPQIAKGEGNAPVQAYIKAIPGWKKDVAKRVDEIISETLPEVKKAVKWNSPFYGIEGQGWFAGVHCFRNYLKIAFFKGVYLTPPLPGQSKQKEVRYLDLHEGELDEKMQKQLAKWCRQAATMPGWLG
jgi:hypothetical protein